MSSKAWIAHNRHPLQVWRVRKRMTQEQLASRVGCSTRTIQHIESGESARPPALIKLFELAGEHFTPSMYFQNLKLKDV